MSDITAGATAIDSRVREPHISDILSAECCTRLAMDDIIDNDREAELGGWLVLVLVILFLICHVLGHPPEPPEIKVASAGASLFVLTPSALTANWTFKLLVHNPNATNDTIALSDCIEASLHYRGVLLSSSNISITEHPNLKPGEDKLLDARFSALRKPLDGEEMAVHRQQYGALNFTISLLGEARYGWDTSHPYVMKVRCRDVEIGFPALGPGKLLRGPTSCKEMFSSGQRFMNIFYYFIGCFMIENTAKSISKHSQSKELPAS